MAIPAALLAAQAFAQDEQAPAPVETPSYTEVWGEWTPTWSDQEIAETAGAFIGAWKTTQAVASTGEDSASVDMLMTISPAPVEGVADALYVEQYRSDSPARPFRQSVMQFYRFKDGIRLRTYEILGSEDLKGVLTGMGMLPEAFPELSRDDLIATLDLDIKASSTGFAGKTPYPYPTGVGGAVEMTSEISVSGDSMRTADRGIAADGAVVWGSGDDAAYTWSRTKPWAKLEKRDGGLAILDLYHAEDDKPEAGGRVYVHYTGWTADGNKFDSSRDKGQPWPLTWPVSEMRVIDGWKQGFDGIMKGTVRKLVIPAALAYGERGVPRAGIGPNANLYFDAEVIAVQPPPPPPAEEAPAAEGQGED
jgi:hypothetical protein